MEEWHISGQTAMTSVASSGSTVYTRIVVQLLFTWPQTYVLLCIKFKHTSSLRVANSWMLELQNTAVFPGVRLLHSCGAAF